MNKCTNDLAKEEGEKQTGRQGQRKRKRKRKRERKREYMIVQESA